jgi:hypothetical protein
MSSVAHASWLSQALGRLPPSWLAALDAWSYRVARNRLERRRLAAQPRRPAQPIDYQLKPWRD